MAELRVGFVGWRGLVGQVLMERMREENDLKGLALSFFSTSNAGGEGPAESLGQPLLDAYDIKALSNMDVVLSCQGGDYTAGVYSDLLKSGWKGYWIDAASKLRMDGDSVIVLDPVNKNVIESYLARGGRTLVGGNCTVSLMLMALCGLFRENLVEWVNSMTYQAVSGAGANQMTELMEQMRILGQLSQSHLQRPAATALSLEKELRVSMRAESFPVKEVGAPIAASVIPWIDSLVDNGQTREEWKGMVEANKILGNLSRESEIIIDGICVRVGVLRCHSQSILLKLRQDVSLATLESLLAGAHEWAKVVPNDKASTLRELTPAAVSGSLQVPVGRLHFSRLGNSYLQLFTLGDQLLWGAAEPLRRVFVLLREHLGR